ncbi:MAG: ABC transporter substrate-binding protein [Gammaproteobacteria bacterium]|nr:ABC transporter substrate-binding protein [Gammaproteobacteria bacterium]MBU1440086.1 ABC transporter substrate-binding protein [Gammaproteobacteria bacterium]MBU2286199.1 ABC transporter substrate-binding protein [Gammaproteobacteria bacterium]
MSKFFRSLARCGAAAVLCSAVSAYAQPLEKFTFALNWFAVGDHAAYWVALDKGYFKDAGLDVTLENSKGSGDSIAKVDTGRADAGLADAVAVLGAQARGARVKMIGMVFDKTPLNFFSRKDMPITKPKDLEGKNIGAPPGDGQRQAWPAFAKLHKIDESKVTWVNIEPSAKIAALAEKRVDAVGDYTTGLPFYEKAMGKGNAVMMPWADTGFDLYSMSIMAGDKTMKDRPKVLKAFMEAAYKGWRDVMKDPKEALAIFKKRVPEIDLAIIEPNMMLGLDLMRTQTYADKGIGWIDDKKMCESVDIVNTYMGLPRKLDCKAVYTTEFLTKVAMPLPVK